MFVETASHKVHKIFYVYTNAVGKKDKDFDQMFWCLREYKNLLNDSEVLEDICAFTRLKLHIEYLEKFLGKLESLSFSDGKQLSFLD